VSHGLKGRLLTKNELQMLTESRDMDELVTRMKNTVYLDALAKLTKPYTADKIENALKEYLVNTHSKMVNVSGGILVPIERYSVVLRHANRCF
jgi:V/A-type H+-transporting ATPase subunit C